MNKVIPLTKNPKDYEDVPDGLKWAIPIHECLERPEVKEHSRRLEEKSRRGGLRKMHEANDSILSANDVIC